MKQIRSNCECLCKMETEKCVCVGWAEAGGAREEE